MSKKILMIFALLLWTASVLLWIFFDWWYLTLGLALLHFVELFAVGYKRGIANNYSRFTSIVFTLLFGITWWRFLDK